MSDNVLMLIPALPHYVPPAAAIRKAHSLLSEWFSEADDVKFDVSEEIRFIDQGENWERVVCPKCGTELDPTWWGEAMDTAHQTGFSELSVTLPCCGTVSSLNDLKYEWPAGFARFVLEVRNPEKEIGDRVLLSLERLLACRLRRIWARH